jgi:hypothetical protein
MRFSAGSDRASLFRFDAAAFTSFGLDWAAVCREIEQVRRQAAGLQHAGFAAMPRAWAAC